MQDRYLEVTYRKGKPLAAYLYLPRPSGAKSARTEQLAPGILVDFSETEQAIGIEITDPQSVPPQKINEIVQQLGFDSLDPEELAAIPAP